MFQYDVLGMFDNDGRIADDGAEEFLLGHLFEVGEAEFGEEFLRAIEFLASYGVKTGERM